MTHVDLKNILDELKIYLRFQKAMGLSGVAAFSREKDKQTNTENAKKTEETEKTKSDMKSVIKIKQQPGIFDRSNRKLSLEQIREELGDCRRCKLHESRTNIVFGEGSPKARVVFVGEGPGQEEDKQGRPFVGRAGQLLEKILNAMGLERRDVYIANVVKSRPPGNRTPESDEIAACETFLFQQIKAIEPEIIVCLGTVAAQTVLKTKERIGNLRGKLHSYESAKVMATYHPAALLRNPGFKKPLWDDMQIVMEELGISK